MEQAPLVAPTLKGARIVVITTAHGIGGAIATSLRTAGAGVVTAGERPDSCDCRHIESAFVSRAEADRVLNAVGEMLDGVDVFVHAAPLPDDPLIAPTDQMSEAQWIEAQWIEASERPVLRAMFALQAAYPHLSKQGGRVVLVQPSIGYSGLAGGTAIGAAVEGQRILGKVAARQWGRAGISVNTLLISAELMIRAPEHLPSIAKVAVMGTGQVPPALREVGMSDVVRDVVPIAAFLASPTGGLMTGQTLVADGGAWMVP